MRRLGPLVNLVPVIVKCDTLKPTEVSQLKVAVLKEIEAAEIPIYGFGMTAGELSVLAGLGVQGSVPFALSNHASTPHFVNEFEIMKSLLFCVSAQELRVLTAERFVRWRDARVERDRSRFDPDSQRVMALKLKEDEMKRNHAKILQEQQQQHQQLLKAQTEFKGDDLFDLKPMEDALPPMPSSNHKPQTSPLFADSKRDKEETAALPPMTKSGSATRGFFSFLPKARRPSET
jgi:hypothetical protein